jgi:hypothetical protein
VPPPVVPPLVVLPGSVVVPPLVVSALVVPPPVVPPPVVPLLPVDLHRAGFGFLVENGYALMQLRTSAASFCWSQALKKSAWMVEAAPEESLTLPEAVGIGK